MKMDRKTIDVIEECAAKSLAGTMMFPEVVRRLGEAGVERYHADYTRGETTYYTVGGESHVVRLGHGGGAIAMAFNAQGVEGAIRQSQRGEIKYADFLRLTMAAGCVGYFVQLVGRRAMYFGRGGELHTEPFPGGK
jgi:uncharacterized protein YbcV (DUF1398 family)